MIIILIIPGWKYIVIIDDQNNNFHDEEKNYDHQNDNSDDDQNNHDNDNDRNINKRELLAEYLASKMGSPDYPEPGLKAFF